MAYRLGTERHQFQDLRRHLAAYVQSQLLAYSKVIGKSCVHLPSDSMAARLSTTESGYLP